MQGSPSTPRLSRQSSRGSLNIVADVDPPARGRSISENTDATGRQPGAPSSVRVVVRFRPPLTPEERSEPRSSFFVDERVGSVKSADWQQQFLFDSVLGENATQEAVYSDVGNAVVDDVLEGYNGTILAYGQTGSGKTYCMFGTQGPSQELELPGLVPRAAKQIFDKIGRDESVGTEYIIQCSFFEVYCEQLRDLLKPKNQNLQVKEMPKHGFYVDGLTHRSVNSANELLQTLRSGLRLRAAAHTQLNNHSSRSHAIFTISLHQRSADRQGCTERHRKLTLVDLAGSEKVTNSGSTGQKLEEAKKINSSLSALGNVIDALADRRPHVPYRDSRLTRILEDSLGGNCRTTLIVTCSPSVTHASETLSSLRFAARAKKVCNYVRINAPVGIDVADRQLLERIARLQHDLAGAHRDLERRFAQHGAGSSAIANALGTPSSPRTLLRSLAEDGSPKYEDGSACLLPASGLVKSASARSASSLPGVRHGHKNGYSPTGCSPSAYTSPRVVMERSSSGSIRSLSYSSRRNTVRGSGGSVPTLDLRAVGSRPDQRPQSHRSPSNVANTANSVPSLDLVDTRLRNEGPSSFRNTRARRSSACDGGGDCSGQPVDFGELSRSGSTGQVGMGARGAGQCSSTSSLDTAPNLVVRLEPVLTRAVEEVPVSMIAKGASREDRGPDPAIGTAPVSHCEFPQHCMERIPSPNEQLCPAGPNQRFSATVTEERGGRSKGAEAFVPCHRQQVVGRKSSTLSTATGSGGSSSGSVVGLSQSSASLGFASVGFSQTTASASVTPMSMWRNLDEDEAPGTRRSNLSAEALSVSDNTLWFQTQLELERHRCTALTEELERRVHESHELQQQLHDTRAQQRLGVVEVPASPVGVARSISTSRAPRVSISMQQPQNVVSYRGTPQPATGNLHNLRSSSVQRQFLGIAHPQRSVSPIPVVVNAKPVKTAFWGAVQPVAPSTAVEMMQRTASPARVAVTTPAAPRAVSPIRTVVAGVSPIRSQSVDRRSPYRLSSTIVSPRKATTWRAVPATLAGVPRGTTGFSSLLVPVSVPQPALAPVPGAESRAATTQAASPGCPGAPSPVSVVGSCDGAVGSTVTRGSSSLPHHATAGVPGPPVLQVSDSTAKSAAADVPAMIRSVQTQAGDICSPRRDICSKRPQDLYTPRRAHFDH